METLNELIRRMNSDQRQQLLIQLNQQQPVKMKPSWSPSSSSSSSFSSPSSSSSSSPSSTSPSIISDPRSDYHTHGHHLHRKLIPQPLVDILLPLCNEFVKQNRKKQNKCSFSGGVEEHRVTLAELIKLAGTKSEVFTKEHADAFKKTILQAVAKALGKSVDELDLMTPFEDLLIMCAAPNKGKQPPHQDTKRAGYTNIIVYLTKGNATEIYKPINPPPPKPFNDMLTKDGTHILKTWTRFLHNCQDCKCK
jgi:hypothetical protein